MSIGQWLDSTLALRMGSNVESIVFAIIGGVILIWTSYGFARLVEIIVGWIREATR